MNSRMQAFAANLANQRKTVVLGDVSRNNRFDRDGVARVSAEVEKIVKSESTGSDN